jgi:hypothetical protein
MWESANSRERIERSGRSEAAIRGNNIPTLEESSTCFLHYELYHEREGLTRVNLKGPLDEVMSRESNDERKCNPATPESSNE